jgi:hypothetical protein
MNNRPLGSEKKSHPIDMNNKKYVVAVLDGFYIYPEYGISQSLCTALDAAAE